MSGNRQLNWLDTTGGPFILLERGLLPHWYGNSGVAGGQSGGGASGPSDYDRACGVEDYVGVISVGPGEALILGDEPMRTTWWPTGMGTGLLIRWMWATSEDAVVEAVSGLPADAWEEMGVGVSFPQGDLVLFDSSCHFAEIDASLSIRLGGGDYSVQTATYQPDDGGVSLLLHRLVPTP